MPKKIPGNVLRWERKSSPCWVSSLPKNIQIGPHHEWPKTRVSLVCFCTCKRNQAQSSRKVELVIQARPASVAHAPATANGSSDRSPPITQPSPESPGHEPQMMAHNQRPLDPPSAARPAILTLPESGTVHRAVMYVGHAPPLRPGARAALPRVPFTARGTLLLASSHRRFFFDVV